MSVHGVIFLPTTYRLFNKIFSDRQIDSIKMGKGSGPEKLKKFRPLDAVLGPKSY